MKKILSFFMSVALLVALAPKISFAVGEDNSGSRDAGASSNVFDKAKKFAKGIDGKLLSKCGLNPKCTKGTDGKGSCDFELKCGDATAGTLSDDPLHKTILPGLIDKCGRSLACNLKTDGSGSCTLSLDCSGMSGENGDQFGMNDQPTGVGTDPSWWEVIKSFRWYHHILNTFGLLFLGALMFRN